MSRYPRSSHRVPRIPRLGGYPGLAEPGDRKQRTRRGARRPGAIFFAIVILALILVLALFHRHAAATEAHAVAPPQLRALFRQLDASVVTVNSAHVVEYADIADAWDNATFGDFLHTHLRMEDGSSLSATVGSGFVISPDGLIVTAAHVLQGSVSVLIELHDRRLLPAEIVGLDLDADIALIQVHASNLSPVRFGDSKKLMLGDPLVSIGAPFGLAHTMSAGMVSGAGRVAIPDNRTLMIQTDLPVNPGSSGSPLFNRQGKVVGMNTIIFTYDGGFNGVSLAVPIELIRAAVDRIRSGVASPQGIGARFRDLPPILARVLGVERSAAIVTAVEACSQAMSGGLQVGDVVIECDGHAVSSATELLSALAASPGTTMHVVKVVRERRSTLVQLPAQYPGM